MGQDDDPPIRIERSYYDDGTLRTEVHFRGVSAHGPWRKWHPNGQLAEEWWLERGVYTNCTNRVWYPDGQLKSEWVYVNERQVEARHYTPLGKIMATLANEQRKPLRSMLAKASRAKPRLARRANAEEAASTSAFVDERLSGRVEPAREWLRGDGGSKRNLGEMDHAVSVEFVDGLFELGAAEVFAVEIEEIHGTNDQTSNHLVVRLPDDPAARARVFAFGRAHAKSHGFDGDVDYGQQHLYFMLC